MRIVQTGAAIISVLLTVSLATLIVSGLFLREHITVRSVENRLALTQTRWVERAAVDWSKVILAADLRTGQFDHLGEPWAVPVEETRLDETVTAGARIDDDARAATLSGSMHDAQGRLNLNNLITTLDADAAGAPTIDMVQRGIWQQRRRRPLRARLIRNRCSKLRYRCCGWVICARCAVLMQKLLKLWNRL